MEEMETMMYKSCIFDLDGTLTDTLDSLTFSVNLTMKEMGLPEITRDQCRMFVGNGSRVLLEKALRAASEEALERLEEAMEIYGRVFNENCMYHVAPYEGIVQLLGTLKEQGIRCHFLHGLFIQTQPSVLFDQLFMRFFCIRF